MLESFLCSHDWEVLVDKVLQAPIKNMGQRDYEGKNSTLQWMLHEESITILKCKKCGKLNKTVISNY